MCKLPGYFMQLPECDLNFRSNNTLRRLYIDLSISANVNYRLSTTVYSLIHIMIKHLEPVVNSKLFVFKRDLYHGFYY